MTKVDLSKVVNRLWLSTKKHSPEILTGIGIAGMITTTIMAVKATPKALDKMVEIKEKRKNQEDKKEFAKDVITKVAPVYIPATVIGGLSISCLIGASSVNFKRNAALATAYTLSESALKDYQNKVIETFGEKKDEIVRAAVSKDKIEKDPVENKEVIITSNGNTLCYDSLSGRYFKSDMQSIKKAVNDLNYRMFSDMYVSLNELYDELGLEHNDTGDLLGWTIDRGQIEIEYDSHIASDGTPCLVLNYSVAPRYDYN